MIKIPCEYRLSKRCPGHRMVKKRYFKALKHRACKPCISIFLSQKRNTECAIKESREHRPSAKETRKPECDHYYKCLTAAGLANRPTVGCDDCERESYTLKPQLDVFPNMNADDYYTLSSDLRKTIHI